MPHRDLKPAGAKELLESQAGWIYVDVRTPEEFGAGHVAGAYNVPFALRDPSGRLAANSEFAAVIMRLFRPDAKLVLGCAVGGRSQRACELLSTQGYASLVNMQGGFSGARDETGQVVEPGWQSCGYPCETAAPADRTWSTLRAKK